MQVIDTLPRLPRRAADANKGSFGKVLVVAGSRGMSGAAVLCAGGALRGGAGLVRLAVPAGIQPVVAAANPCYMTLGLPEDADGRLAGARAALAGASADNTVAVVGPGLGRSAGVAEAVGVLVESPLPLVLDADALNVLAGTPFPSRSALLVLTPHPGEFARLTGADVPTVQADRQGLAAAFAREHGAVVVLKGAGTVVTDGRRLHVNTTGNPGLATGGTGDVLAGLIAALLGQGLEAFAAAQLGVYLHGAAGDLARDAVGEVSLIASDLLDHLPRAFLALPAGG